MKEKETSTNTVPQSKVKTSKALLGFAIVLVVIFAIGVTTVYAFPDSIFGMRVRSLLPLPAVVVNNDTAISFRDLDANLASVRKFYESQAPELAKSGIRVDFSTPEGQKRLMLHQKELLNKMTEDAAIEVLAKERGIRITDESVHQNLDRKLKEFNSEEDVRSRLSRLYGWSLDDLEQKSVRPETYKEELAKFFAKEADVSTQPKETIQKARNALQSGMSFEEVAMKYSEGATAKQGGDLGWIAVSDLTPEVAQAVKSQAIGRPTDVVESQLGFHILRVDERKKDVESGDMVHMKQIFSRKMTFSDWLSDQMQQMKIRVWFKDYEWNPETARIEFRRQDLKDFEQKHLEEIQKDFPLSF